MEKDSEVQANLRGKDPRALIQSAWDKWDRVTQEPFLF